MVNNHQLMNSELFDSNINLLLEKKFKNVIDNFEKEISIYDYECIESGKWNKLYIINDIEHIYIGVVYNYNQFYSESLDSISIDEYIKKIFTIIIQKVPYNKNDKYINYDLFADKINNIFGFDFIKTSNGTIDKRMLSSMFDNKIDINGLFNKYKNYIINNPNAIKTFNIVVNELKKFFGSYNFHIYEINNYEHVFVLEDILVIYVGLKDKKSMYYNIDDNELNRYALVIQELSYNELFDKKKFKNYIKEIKILEVWKKNIYYRPFSIGNPYERIIKGYNEYSWGNSNFDYVDKNVPQIMLKQRLKNWQGILRYYIVYEFNYNNKKGFAISTTLDYNPRIIARNIIRKYENEGGYLGIYTSYLYKDKLWNDLMKNFVCDQKQLNWSGVKRIGSQSSIFAERISYFIVPIYINNNNSKFDYNQIIINDINNGLYDNYERTIYDITEYKWKSEELMLECVKKVFPKQKVLHQYRPYFLHTKTGQLSYDVFVCGKNIAFEYQGKQHFEPVEIFGGKENFIKQQERDVIKKKISDEHHIQLIYVNYWENVSVDLINEKIEELTTISS